MSLEYSLFPQSTVYVPRIQFMSPEYSLSPRSKVYISRAQFTSQEYSLCPECSLCPQSTVYRNYCIQGNKNQECMHSWNLCLI